jgi:putative transposase
MLVKGILDAIIFERPSQDEGIQNICMEKDMIFLKFRIGQRIWLCCHIKSRGEENIRIGDTRF